MGKNPLKDIPPELPALVRAVKTIKKTDKLYEKQPDLKDTFLSIKEQTERLQKALLQEKEPYFKQVVGEILWSIANLSRLLSVDAEQALVDKTEDFLEKYE